MKILVIDDAPEIRWIARFGLARIGGMEVIEAAGGAEGVAAARAERPDAILLDVVMPDMRGPQVLATLKASTETADIPVIFLTAAREDAPALLALGAAGVLGKPFAPLSLAAEVRALLDASRLP